LKDVERRSLTFSGPKNYCSPQLIALNFRHSLTLISYPTQRAGSFLDKINKGGKMKKIEYSVRMDKEKCNGDQLCANICPADAISMVDNKAVSDTELCVACFKCIDICPHDAVISYDRDVPRIAFVDPEEVDQEAIRELCVKAEVDQNEVLCWCTQTTAKEVAAAIIKGAKTPEEITVMTGIRSGCLIFCTVAILRMCKTHYPDFIVERGDKYYNTLQTAMSVSEELIEKYPLFGIKQDQENRQRLINQYGDDSQKNGGEPC
jgi:ferredoxin